MINMNIQSKMTKILLATSFFFLPFTGNATTTIDDTSSETTAYLDSLGWYMGFNLANPISPSPTPITSIETPDLTEVTNTQFAASSSYLAALPFLVDVNNFVTYIPASLSGYTTPYDLLMNIPTSTYSVWNSFSTPGTIESTKASAIFGIDQMNASTSTGYYSDITKQSIFNLLTTPDYTYCTQDNTNTTDIYSDTHCSLLASMSPAPLHSYEIINAIMNGGGSINRDTNFIAFGANLPAPTTYFSAAYNEPLVSQLDADTLMGPLMYNTDTAEDIDEDATGYPYGSQQTQAIAFIRYLSGSNLPSVLPNYTNYTTTYNNIISTTADAGTRNDALKSFYNYFMNLRTYAAGMSVGISNLSGILGSRMKNSLTDTSQAFDEYTMATRRVLNPNNTVYNMGSNSNATNKWITQMESASPLAMQREMLYLLAEINYQLYLARKQDEKILLTLSTMELQYTNSSRSGLTMESGGSGEGDSE